MRFQRKDPRETSYRKTKERLETAAARPEAVQERLTQVSREASLERAVQISAAGLLALAGALLLTGGGLLRRAGFRSQAEIDEERTALKVLRGDFETRPGQPPSSALDLAKS